MKSFICFVFLFTFSVSAQTEKPRFRRHFIEIAPVALTFKRGVNVHHHLEYRFLITPYLYLNASTTGGLFKKFDYSGDGPQGIFPMFNESSLVLGYQHALHELTETNRSTSLIGVDAGYHYIQYATAPYHDEYGIIDTTEFGFRMLGGFRVHSLKAGFSYQHIIYSEEKDKPTIRFRHFLSMAYLYGIDFQQPTFLQVSSISAMKDENLIGNSWRSRDGFRVEYTFQHFLSKRIGLLYGFNFTWAPFVDYIPNDKYFVPRGSEINNPTALNFRIGITIQ